MNESAEEKRGDTTMRLSLPAAGVPLDDPAAESSFAPFVRLALRAFSIGADPTAPGAIAFLLLDSGSGLQLHSCAGQTRGEALPLAVIRAQMNSRRRVLVDIQHLDADKAHLRAPAHEREAGFATLAGTIIRDPAGNAAGLLGLLGREARRRPREMFLCLADIGRGVAALLAASGRQVETGAASSDALTGLPDRRTLSAGLNQWSAPGSKPYALFRIDFGRLAALNDAHGREVADRYLRLLADRLRTVTPLPGFLAHLGGSGFALMAPGKVSSSDAEAMALRIMERLREPVQLGGLELPVRPSLGMALFPADLPAAEAAGEARSPDEGAAMLQAAEAALAHARQQGDGRHSRASRAIVEGFSIANALELDLQSAAATGAFHLNWMATIDTANEHVTGFEALLRWNRPGFGEVSPALFIPVAESAGLIEQLDSWALRAACTEAQGWDTPLSVAVNISSVWLSDQRLTRTVRRVLDETGLDPTRLQLELSARTTLDQDGGLRRELSQVRAMGVRLTLDDFGSGYSSLGALTLFPFNKVKFDRQFTTALGQDRRLETMTRSILQMLQSLGMTCCAEGVETEAQLAFLDAHGCDEIQGYLLGRPAPELPGQSAGVVEPTGL